MALTDLLIRGSSVAVVVFVVSSTLGVGLSLTVGQILAPLKNARLVVLFLAANFVLAPLVALGLWRVLGLDEPLGIGLLLCRLAAGAPFLIKLAEFAKADLAFAWGPQATEFAKSTLLGQRVAIVTDPSQGMYDRFGLTYQHS